MSESWTDPASLEGDALTQWYQRSPADIEEERQAAAARRYQDFFYGGTVYQPDPGFDREASTSGQDIDPGIAIQGPSRDIDPGITWVAVGPNRMRSVRIAADGQPADPSLLRATSYKAPSPTGQSDVTGQSPDAASADSTSSQFDLTPQPVVRPDGELRTLPAFGFASAPPADARSTARASYGGVQPQAPRPTVLAANSGHPPVPTSGPSSGQTITYGALRAPAPSDQEMAELRRQQAAFADTTRKIDLQNSWFAIPALAPPLVALGLGAAGEWATGEMAPRAGQAVANFIEKDPYLRVGDNWATRAGRRAHAALKERLAQKEGWEYEPKLARPGEPPLKPDLGTPKRNPQLPDKRMYGELKPDSPSGRTAGARALKKYQALTDDYIRLFLYNLKGFI